VTRRNPKQGMNWIRRSTRLAIYARDGWCCVYCGAAAEQRGVGLTLDHVVPCDRGGTNEPENLVTCCKGCNDSKQHTPLSSWARRWWESADVVELQRRVRNAVRRQLDRGIGRSLARHRGHAS